MSEVLAQLEKKGGGGGNYTRAYEIGMGHANGYGHSQVTLVDLKAKTATCVGTSENGYTYSVNDDYVNANASLTATLNMAITLKQPALVAKTENGVTVYSEYPATTTLTYNLAKDK